MDVAMISQIENGMIKKKLNYVMILGILYFISALWLIWWENITGKSFLLFIGLTCAAFLVLKLTPRNKMIVVNFIVLILIVCLLHDYIPRFFLLGDPIFLFCYLFLICIPILHIFCLFNPVLNKYFVFENEKLQKIDEIVKFRRIVPKRATLIFILFLLSLWGIVSNKIVKMPTIDRHMIPFKNIQFLLRGNCIVAKPYMNIPGEETYFGEYDFEFLDAENKLLSVFYRMDYDFKSGIIFGESFESTVGKGYFRIGK